MKNKIIDSIGKIDDDMIESVDALRQSPQKRSETTWIKWGAMAACLCIAIIVCTKVIPTREMEKGVPDNSTIGDEKMCQVIKFNIPENYSVSSLYYLSKPINGSIRKYIEENNINVNPDNGISVFYLSDEQSELHYWFPVIKDDRITEFVYISQTQNGTIGCGYSQSDVDLMEALSVYTSEENPMSLVVYGNYAYFMIGNNAYISDGYNSRLTEIPKLDNNSMEVQQHVIELR